MSVVLDRNYRYLMSTKVQDYLERLFSLKGEVAVILGGSGTLCYEMAEAMAKVGAKVVLVGRDKEKGEQKASRLVGLGLAASFEACDVTKRDALQALCDRVVEKNGKLSILVTGAAINSPTPILEIADEEFARIMETNFTSVFRACQIFGAQMIKQGSGGCIINIGSEAGVTPLSRVFTYSASKAAVHNLSKNLAREWAPHKIRVNTLVPGFFPAEQNRKILDESRVNSIMVHTPMKRFGEPKDLVGATLLLAAPIGGAFITGCELVVDGGFDACKI